MPDPDAVIDIEARIAVLRRRKCAVAALIAALEEYRAVACTGCPSALADIRFLLPEDRPAA